MAQEKLDQDKMDEFEAILREGQEDIAMSRYYDPTLRWSHVFRILFSLLIIFTAFVLVKVYVIDQPVEEDAPSESLHGVVLDELYA